MAETVKICVHQNNPGVEFGKHCLHNGELKPGQIVTLHYHEHCTICPNGHCHAANVALLYGEDGNLCLTVEQIEPPNKITVADFVPHGETLH